MTSELTNIFGSLYRFVDIYVNEREAMTNHWYGHAARDIARVFKNAEGNKLIVNSSSLVQWERIAKRLLLVADLIAIRDTRPLEQKFGAVYMDDFDAYDRSSIAKMPLPPVGRDLAFPSSMWCQPPAEFPLVNGRQAAFAALMYEAFPQDAYDWIHGGGRQYHETGSIFYAPFIPPIEVELEFMKHRVSVPELLGAEPLYCEANDYFSDDDLIALAALQLPTLENVSLEDLTNIKSDYNDEFLAFSRSILKAVTSIKSSVGSELFAKEVRSIQRDLIDDSLDKLDRKYKQISRMRSLSAGGVFVGSIGLSFAAFSGAAAPVIATGLAATVAASIAHTATVIKEKYGQYESPMHFLWRLKRADT